jgi:hypothetical protein
MKSYNMFSDDDMIKFKMKSERIFGTPSPKTFGKLKTYLTLCHGSKRKSQGTLKNYFELNNMNTQCIKMCGMQLKKYLENSCSI